VDSTLEIIEDLFEGTLDAIAWDRAILRIADSVRAAGAMIYAFNPKSKGVLRDENHRVDPRIVTEYARHWTYLDTRFEAFLATPAWQPQTEMTLAIPNLQRTQIYNEFLVRVDLPHFMPVWLHKSAEKVVGLSLQGSGGRGAFSPQDVEAFRKLLPYLARAFEIRDRLEAANIRAANFAKVLDNTSFGVILLNGRMRILEANAMGEAMLRQEPGLQRARDGTLQIISSMKKTVVFEPRRIGTDIDTLMHIPREGKLPLSVLAVPTSPSYTTWLSGHPAWMLLVFDAERTLTVNEKIIAKDLGLSQREARVASLLASGLQLETIALRMNVTVHTVRSQLKAVFHKTGCHSQADLVRLILLGPSLTILT
jgi:DNA-binding CsgD family transcriptional regulator/PAS domain-containing protein